jgi:hypothetical protein
MEESMNPFDAGADSPVGGTLAIASDEAVVISAKAGMHLAYAELCRRRSTLMNAEDEAAGSKGTRVQEVFAHEGELIVRAEEVADARPQ